MSFSRRVLVEGRGGSGGEILEGIGRDNLGRHSYYKGGWRMESMRSLPLPGGEHCHSV